MLGTAAAIANVNKRISGTLAQASRALRGEAVFVSDDVLGLRALLAEMEAVLAEAKPHRASDVQIASELDRYYRHLADLHAALEHVRIMLVAQRSELDAGRSHMEAVGNWSRMLRQTSEL